MRSENGFRHGACLEQAETKQNGVAHNAPNGVDGIPGNRHALDQHSVNISWLLNRRGSYKEKNNNY